MRLDATIGGGRVGVSDHLQDLMRRQVIVALGIGHRHDGRIVGGSRGSIGCVRRSLGGVDLDEEISLVD